MSGAAPHPRPLVAMPPAMKQALARAATLALPQCRFERAVFLLGHMRCGSTALSRVLCAHPAISGHGEAHIAYGRTGALGQLLLNQWRRGAWKPRARYLHDKLLHDGLDAGVPARFTAARAIFLVREPAAAIRSIRHLFGAIGSAEYASDAEAAAYYGARLGRLEQLWHAFPAHRRLGLDHGALTGDPAAALAYITRLLGLAQPLANGYGPAPKPAPGAGDPLASPRFNAIVPAALSTSLASEPRPIDLPDGQLAALERQYRALTELFGIDRDRNQRARNATASDQSGKAQGAKEIKAIPDTGRIADAAGTGPGNDGSQAGTSKAHSGDHGA